jgi:hypothetical protein
MARPKRNVILLDALIWTHDGIRNLPPKAALAYIFMIAWSKASNKQGVVTKTGAEFCRAGEDEIQALLTAKPEPFLVPHEEGWLIPKFSEWQVQEQATAPTEFLKAMGSKGGETKRDNAERRQQEVETGVAEPIATREQWLAVAMGEWPGPSNGFSPEHPKNVKIPFLDNVKTSADWAQFQLALDAVIERYKRDPRPREQKRQYLGSLKNFCLKWRDEIPLPLPLSEHSSDQVIPVAPPSTPLDEDIF